MTRAVAYLRVSTDEQAASGAGLAAQVDACRTHAGRAGWELAATHSDEGVSGASGLDKRPALLRAVAELAKGDVLLVAKRDRLGRDPIAVAMIEAAVTRRGARVVSAAGEGTDGDGPADVLMRRIVDAFAEYERLVLRARTGSALKAKRDRSERVGQVPYGRALADDGFTLVEAAAELGLFAEIRGLRAGGWSLRRIASELTRRGVPTKNGGPKWAHTTVAELLGREGSDGGGSSPRGGDVAGDREADPELPAP